MIDIVNFINRIWLNIEFNIGCPKDLTYFGCGKTVSLKHISTCVPFQSVPTTSVADFGNFSKAANKVLSITKINFMKKGNILGVKFTNLQINSWQLGRLSF